MDRPIKNNNGGDNATSKRTRRDDCVKLLRMDIIAPLFKRGYTYREIREEVMARLNLPSYSLATVKHDVEALLKEWRDTRIDNTDEAVQLELQRIDDLVKEAWVAWDKSKEDYEKTKAKATAVPSVGSGGGSGSTRTIKKEQWKEMQQRIGDPRFIDTINKLLIERRKLLGLYAPDKHDVNTDLSFADFLMKTGQKKSEA